MIDSEEVLRILRLLGIVEWGRFSVGVDPIDGLYKPPMIAWRYATPNPELARTIGEAISALDGSVEWDFDYGQKNWTIMPISLKRSFERHASDSYTGVLTDFKRSNQAFCESANAELVALLLKLQAVTDG